MASNFTVILFQRQHFGNQPGIFNGIEPHVPFVGPTKDFLFNCPNVDPGETAVLMFQSRDVDHQRNVFQVNGVDVFGGLPVSPSRDTWNGNILLIEPRHELREIGNVLHVESRNSSGGSDGDIDDFIIDNVVIEYKTRAVSFTEGTDVTAQLNAMLAALVKDGGWGGRLLLPQGGPFYLSDTIRFTQIAGQELFGQGARATRFVWRGPGDRPAFDFNRCQDCGLGHFSLEVEPDYSLQCAVRIYNSATALSARRAVSTVEPNSDELRFTATHPFMTGSRVRLATTNTLPSGLATGTDYWVIKLSDTTIALATSFANALAGTRIGFSDQGFGTHTVLSATTVVSSVSPGSDTLTIPGHPFVKGQPVRLSSPIGLGSSLPGGLDGGTDYWVIHIDADTIALATSYSNALAGTRIDITNAGSGSFTVDPRVVPAQLSSRNFIEHASFLFGGRATDGVQIVWDPAATEEAGKNDHHRLTNVQIQGYTDSGIVIQGDQSLAHVFTGCILQGRDTGQAGINTARRHALDPPGVYRAGSLKWYGGTIMENQIADIYLARQSNGPVVVSGVHSEGSVRLLDMRNFDQDITQLIDRVHIELTGIKHHVPSPPEDGECIRYFGNGPLIITACDFGKQIDPAPYRVRFQSRQGVNNGFMYNATVSSQDTKALFTAQLPSRYDAAYRHTRGNNNRALIDLLDGTPPRQKPVSEEDWLRVLGILPRCWYRFGETALNASTGSKGLIYDCNRRLPPINMMPNAAPLYRQARAGFGEEWAHFTSATIDQQFYLNEIDEINPRARSVAFLVHHGEVMLTAGGEYLCVLGCGSAGAGGGPIVWFTPDGRMRATTDGVTQEGTHDYRTPPGDYLTIAGYDYTAGGVFTVQTDREFIVVPTPSLNVGNDARKGLGTGLSAGTLRTAGYQVGLFAVFVGKDAEKLIAMGSEAHKRMGW